MNQKGQAITELAIIAPLLIILFIGVFEVGYAIRNQMILNTAAREGARFASKPTHMDLVTKEIAQEDYEDIVEQIKLNKLPKELEGIIITNLYVSSGFPCEEDNLLNPQHLVS